jgi:hypothetical protein
MSFLLLILWIAVIGCIVYLIVTYIPMPPIFKTLIYILTAIAVIYILINFFGASSITLPTYR